jgi:hypothetical protein
LSRTKNTYDITMCMGQYNYWEIKVHVQAIYYS